MSVWDARCFMLAARFVFGVLLLSLAWLWYRQSCAGRARILLMAGTLKPRLPWQPRRPRSLRRLPVGRE